MKLLIAIAFTTPLAFCIKMPFPSALSHLSEYVPARHHVPVSALSETLAVVGKRWINQRLQNLQQCLLDQTIRHGRYPQYQVYDGSVMWPQGVWEECT